MTWIKLDDKCPRHPKIATLSDRAFRWWVTGLCYASEFLTDGVVPYAFLRTTPKTVQAELRKAGLWRTGDNGDVHIHDYLAHQADRATVERKLERSRQRVKRWRNGVTSGVRNGVTDDARNAPRDADVTDPDTDTDTDTEKRTSTHTPRARGSAPGPLAGSLPRDHVDHAFCGRFCVTHKTFGDLVRQYGEDGEEPVRGFLARLSDGLGPTESHGGHLWMLRHFEAWLVAQGRVKPAPAATVAPKAPSVIERFRASQAAKGGAA